MTPPAYDFAAEAKLRRRLKAGKEEPTWAGTYVTGRLPGGLYPRTQCEGHVFIVDAARKSVHWQSGWAQSATCIVCDEFFDARDASWWCEAATDEYIREAMELVKQESQRLREVFGILKGILKERGT